MHIIFPRLNLNIERWKWNSEYEVYVSSLGHFRGKDKKPLPIRINSSGYCNVLTSRGYKMNHRLVMLTFYPTNDAENLTVDHIDHNKRNNALNNLEWVTREENWRRAQEDQLPAETLIHKVVITRTLLDGTPQTFKFSSIDEAVTFIKGLPDYQNAISTARLRQIIKNKIACGGKYFGFRWKQI